MKNTHLFLCLLGALAVAPLARADTPAPAMAPAQDEARPPGPAPGTIPPAPAFVNPPPPRGQPIELHQQPLPAPPPPRAAPVPLPAGQWAFTQQYGWLWMPYDQGYTHVVDDAALAYQYAYYPAYGWRWLVAPWVLGFGVAPYWGALGPGHFAWYGHPWFRVGTAHLRPSWGGRAGPRGFVGFGGHHMGGHRR
jgi:hypothetical protein